MKDFESVSRAKILHVTIRNLSEGGICCLHAGFLHKNARCFVELPNLNGEHVRIIGTVRRCEYLADGMHEIGIQFEKPIAIDDHIRLMQALRILVVDDDAAARRLAIHHLSSINATIHEAENGKAAVACVNSHPIDLILMDLDMPELNGIEAIRHIRAADFSGKIAAVTAAMNPAEHEYCLLAGADTIVKKPFIKLSFDALLAALNRPPVTSDYIADPKLNDRIRAFIGRTPRIVRHLQELFIADSHKTGTFAKLVKAVENDAGANGFSQLSETAGHLYSILSYNLDKYAVTKGLIETLNACLFIWMSGRRIALLPETPLPAPVHVSHKAQHAGVQSLPNA